ncbi:HET-domain-containing protein [Aspergillus sclerotioniger CBS 115572]|uniref:HET-domain-containing protein n=1 Tax=Aspergillus sclerotioniger CBS 115572 TaxID=1450535 RepID=A0A317WCM7_9EURO|nr:HET-domain-containing protein [Aspergillus sclerotioniger CBS 115572]PWY83675.1 HET-domain-containing protein [Aspergillus sclerotioniger CBS 115572]
MSRRIKYERRLQDLELEIKRHLVDEDDITREERYELETRGEDGHYPLPRRCEDCNNLSPYGHYPSYFKNDGRWLWLFMRGWVARDDCQFCAFLARVFGHYFEGFRADPINFDLNLKPGNPLFISGIRGNNGRLSSRYGRIDCIEVFKDIENDIPAWSETPFIGGGAMIINHSDDQGVFDFISDCLFECEKSHASCQAVNPLPLPRRLLQVNVVDQSCRLHEPSQDQEGTYTALSYCWGKENPNRLMLTRENYDSFKDEISWDRLPRLFQDAVKITSQLGVAYIWIDSLCIIQDDKKDWEIESQNMASIFENAHLTIVAASSPDPDTPILRGRGLSEEKVKFDFTGKDQSQSYLFSRLTTIRDMNKFFPLQVKAVSSRYWDEMLYKRGWTFQEDLLARRTVHYLPNRVVWECRTLHQDERQWLGERRLAESTNVTLWTWREYVEAYSRRDLTYISDKLPAISGIANRVSQKMGDEYLAGLWKNSLVFDLGWCVGYLSMQEPPPSPPKQYIAPSWSWASLATGTAIFHLADSHVIRTSATVIDADVTLKGQNRFGEVTDGFVQLRGLVREIKIYYQGSRRRFQINLSFGRNLAIPDMDTCTGYGLLESGAKVPTLCRRYADEKPNMKSDEEAYPAVHMLMLFEDDGGNTGLILGRSPRVRGAYERLGLIHFRSKEEFETVMELAVESTITIV